jgi:hypothetical protein
MSTITIHPKKDPLVLIGDLSLEQPGFLAYHKAEAEVEQDLAANHMRAINFRGHGVSVTCVSNNPLVHEPIRSSVRENREAYYKRQFGVRTTYHNYTSHPVVIIERLGMPKVLHPDARSDGHGPSVVIRQEHHFDDKDVLLRTLQAVKRMVPIQGRELKGMLDVMRAEAGTVGKYGCRMVIEYRVEEDEIINTIEQTVYHHKADIVISMKDAEGAPKHPASCEFVETQSPVFNTAPTNADDIGLMLRYVSNDPEATPKYMRFANKIFKLIPQSDHPSKLLAVARRDKKQDDTVLEDRYDYIEFLYPARVDSDNPTTQGIRCTRVSLDDAKSLYGVFDTFQDISNPHEVLETTNRRLKDKLDLSELENKRLTRENADKMLTAQRDAEDKLREARHKIEELEIDQASRIERLKEQREVVVHKQKVSFETIKFVMNMAAIVVGLIPLIMKLKAPAK